MSRIFINRNQIRLKSTYDKQINLILLLLLMNKLVIYEIIHRFIQGVLSASINTSAHGS